jgi:NitT/TauT family transport system substrate-binding protein
MMRWAKAVFGAGAAVLALLGPAPAQDKVRFGTNWVAEAEHGGHYQAVADGTYRRYGLEVEIVPGGPQVNNRLLLLAGRIDFYMGGNTIQAIESVAQNIPTVVVAAIFQKEPQVILSHPGVFDTWESLKEADLLLGKEGEATFFQWMVSEFGFKPEKVRPYTFNPAPFIANKRAAQQGYVTSEPFAVEKQAGFKPNVFLLADQGFDTYATTIETRRELIETRRDMVRRFVDASIVGWYNYLYGDNAKANALIKRDNPEMTDEQIRYSIAKMKEYGIVDSGDSLRLGIGAMTDERHRSFYEKMVKAGVFKPGIDVTKAYTLEFVNKGVGLELRPKP